MRVMVMAVKGGNGFAVLVELGGVDLLLAAARQVHLHPDALLLPPRGKNIFFRNTFNDQKEVGSKSCFHFGQEALKMKERTKTFAKLFNFREALKMDRRTITYAKLFHFGHDALKMEERITTYV